MPNHQLDWPPHPLQSQRGLRWLNALATCHRSKVSLPENQKLISKVRLRKSNEKLQMLWLALRKGSATDFLPRSICLRALWLRTQHREIVFIILAERGACSHEDQTTTDPPHTHVDPATYSTSSTDHYKSTLGVIFTILRLFGQERPQSTPVNASTAVFPTSSAWNTSRPHEASPEGGEKLWSDQNKRQKPNETRRAGLNRLRC